MTTGASDQRIWQGNFQVRSYEVDFRRQATLETVCRYFQEAAWQHADALGVGYHQLTARNQIWVLARFSVRVTRYPLWGETVVTTTWPRAAKSVFALREFELFDSAGKRIATGASAWLVLDALSRKPLRADRLLASLTGLSDRKAMEVDLDKLPACDAAAPSFTVPVTYGDIDMNGHVNNSRYIGWLLNAHSVKFHQQHTPASMEINYLGETRGGERVDVRMQETVPGTHLYAMFKSDSGEEVCRARLKWVKNDE